MLSSWRNSEVLVGPNDMLNNQETCVLAIS